MNEKENHLPNLSDKERAHALELAMKARKRRAVLKARMKSGELAFTDALNEEDAKRIEVVLSVSLFCKSIAEAKEWKEKFGERNWDYLFHVLIALVAIATSGYAIFILFGMR